VDDFQVDVLVVGAGNAAACAALAAREHGGTVAMLEAAPEAERGGNSSYTAGAMRVVFHGVDDLAQLYDLTDDEMRTSISAATPPTGFSTTWSKTIGARLRNRVRNT
jgi:tricarballylate dehydrogenase